MNSKEFKKIVRFLAGEKKFSNYGISSSFEKINKRNKEIKHDIKQDHGKKMVKNSIKSYHRDRTPIKTGTVTFKDLNVQK